MLYDNIVQKIWNLCHVLRGDGVSYHEYISELTYLLFLKIAAENKTEELIPAGYRWDDIVGYTGGDLLTHYRDVLTFLGGHAEDDRVRKIYAFPTTVFSHSENLRAVIDGIDRLDWRSISTDMMGDIYEGLIAKNSQDARSGAGQYFTPRALIDSIVRLVQPKGGELIQDPARLTPQRRHRARLMLRVFDARVAGASYRKIAEQIFPKLRHDAATWDENPVRVSIARLARDGMSYVRGGYRTLLRRPRRSR
ncbi:DNA -binding domain-containing protein [Chelativorans sp.]|uniref:DNA -binding domain-containing protein n=1 Tax=Chelativorans sp. TaxID=2203393 RepID=UPI00281224CD|nr:DUF2285 domain-containing protein [Chelativorans sp.]